MKRSRFIASTTATLSVLWAHPAWATGGLDVDDGPNTDGPPMDGPASDGPPQSRINPQGVDVRVRVGSDDSARYRGNVADIGDARVNTLSLEEYLLGVVPVEMPSAWPQAALEAQAIVARTYALRKRNPAKPYDLVAGTADQMYGGISAESPSATTAVTGTSGMIVTYGGVVADVAYMSCCGGHTEDSQRIWGSDIPYLHGVADPYCADAPDSSWTISLDWNSVAHALKFDTDTASLQGVQVIGMPGARPTALRFLADGTSQDVDVLDLRRISAYRMPSTYIRNATLQRSGDDGMTVVITGSGRGHGVGLCQWGARGMAQAGASAAQILAYYFPTTGLGQASSIT